MTDKEVNNSINASYIHVEQTLAMIKPDAIEKADEIENVILQQGFSILQVFTYFQIYLFVCLHVCVFNDSLSKSFRFFRNFHKKLVIIILVDFKVVVLCCTSVFSN